MHYKEVLSHLFNINQEKKMDLGLRRMQEALNKLGNPEKKFRTIHIAGTNGKGSVSTKIAAGLKNVGLFTSPHISTFRERIQIDGALIEEEAVLTHFQQILKSNLNLTFFETTTLLAFLHFADKKVDYAVIETGIGGRLDATNCILPEISVITSIAKDHTEILGATKEAIAFEKGGIIKENIPIIVGPDVPTNIIKSIAKQKKSPFIQVLGHFNTFDEENSAIAKQVLEHLKIPSQTILQAILKRPPCRIEQVQETPYPIILDVAHNPQGLEALFKSLAYLYPKCHFSAVIGLSSSKDIEGCLTVLQKYAAHLYLVKAPHRGVPISHLADLLNPPHYTCCSSIQEAINQNKGPLVIAGTFFIMDEARKALGQNHPCDPVQLNEYCSKQKI